ANPSRSASSSRRSTGSSLKEVEFLLGRSRTFVSSGGECRRLSTARGGAIATKF
ncbi:hypothetical protein L914_04578, partial [Phytophthora nicotianae]